MINLIQYRGVKSGCNFQLRGLTRKQTFEENYLVKLLIFCADILCECDTSKKTIFKKYFQFRWLGYSTSKDVCCRHTYH